MSYLKGTSICKNNHISKKFKPEENKIMKIGEMSVFDEKKKGDPQEEDFSVFIGCSYISTRLWHKPSKNYWKLCLPCERVFQGPPVSFP